MKMALFPGDEWASSDAHSRPRFVSSRLNRFVFLLLLPGFLCLLRQEARLSHPVFSLVSPGVVTIGAD